MNHRIYLLLSVGLIILTGCSGTKHETETTVVTAISQKVVAQATNTSIPSSKTQELSPSATITEQSPTSTKPGATATSTTTPDPTPIPCDGIITSPQQEGPFFSPGSPERASLIEAGMPGVPLLIIGRVFDQDCSPIPGAKLDFWLADIDGEYDNIGYTLRGHVFTDQDGFYTIESIEPTSYTGRPPHIHVKVYAPTGLELLTTQMYFAGSESSTEVTNSPELFVIYLESDGDGGLQVLFNFVVNY